MEGDHLVFAKKVAEEAARIALAHFSFEVQNTWKGDGTPLTQADTEINHFLVERVASAYPDHSVFGEEESILKKDSKYVWVCDPIDGTMPFSNGLPLFTFSLALVDQSTGQPVLGLVNDPMMKRMYWATKGGGAYRNDKRISVSHVAALNGTYLNVGCAQRTRGFSGMKTIALLREQGAHVMELLSVIYGGIQVANGKFSGTVFFEPYAHDVAALKIITEEAGGTVTDLRGEERRYDEEGVGCVISNGAVHGKLLEVVKQSKTEKTAI